jgi:hypothetical protein
MDFREDFQLMFGQNRHNMDYMHNHLNKKISYITHHNVKDSTGLLREKKMCYMYIYFCIFPYLQFLHLSNLKATFIQVSYFRICGDSCFYFKLLQLYIMIWRTTCRFGTLSAIVFFILFIKSNREVSYPKLKCQ